MFNLYAPLDIVSGDFYWVKQIEHYTVVAVADCTGHGVPGAFMSMLGIAFLNEIARNKFVGKASTILDKLRDEVKYSLEQKTIKARNKEGMDMTILIIDQQTKQAQFAGAHNQMILIRNKELTVYKGDRQPIGISENEEKFHNHHLQLQKNDMIYMFTDGYTDQFGGEYGRKFMIKNFKQLLLKVSELPIDKQKAMIKQTLDSWKKGFQQIDDILVVGIKI
jgi:serine phosphatase RsbU (regulator of sigma subunit)